LAILVAKVHLLTDPRAVDRCTSRPHARSALERAPHAHRWPVQRPDAAQKRRRV